MSIPEKEKEQKTHKHDYNYNNARDENCDKRLPMDGDGATPRGRLKSKKGI